MINNILFLFFKIARKFKYSCYKLYNRFKILYYYYISKQRFVLQSSIIIGKRFSIKSDISNTRITVNDNCLMRDDFNITIGNNGMLTIGENCFFNNKCSINCLGKIEIGNNNQFGEVVLLYDHNHAYGDKEKLITDQGYNIGEIKIGSNCWFGSNVVILKGVEIGDNVIIGAGCVIHKSVPGDTIVVNNQSLEFSKYRN
jgi:acetyltransferase-like isoleucine patch superfamily enzyme